MARKSTKPEPRTGANHGDFALLHGEMLTRFAEWRDEMFLREFGFRLSELERMEMRVARIVTNDNPEAQAERDKLVAEYKAIWRPRRLLLEDRKLGIR